MSPVEKLIAAADVITARTLAVEEIRAIHIRVVARDEDDPPIEYCEACRGEWPCETIAILERRGLL